MPAFIFIIGVAAFFAGELTGVELGREHAKDTIIRDKRVCFKDLSREDNTNHCYILREENRCER